MRLPSQCPSCPAGDTCTLKELARFESAPWWLLLMGKRVRRIVSGYLQICVACRTEFIVTEHGTTKLSEPAPPPSEDGETRPPAKRKEAPQWMQPPPR